MVEKSIIKLLNSYGFKAWICGGTARDIYRKVTPAGYDVAVQATLGDLRKKVSKRILATSDYNTSITIKYGEQIFILYPLKKVRLINTYYNYSFTNSLEEDSSSRDFTINSLYYNPITNEWIDYHNGRKDIDNKIIRFVGDPDTRILESKIRLLRAVVFCGILGEGWILDPRARHIISFHRLKIMTVHSRQLHTEIGKIMLRCEQPSVVFEWMRNLFLLDVFFPELHYCKDIEQSNKAKNLDLYRHILLALDSIKKDHPRTLVLRLAALLHDIGKPYTQTYTKTGLHFYSHENVGAFLAERILHKWGFSKEVIIKVKSLISDHLFDASPHISEVAVKRLIARVGPENIHDLLDLRIADRYGTGRKNIRMDKVEQLRNRVNKQLSKLKPSEFRLQISDDDLNKIIGKSTEVGSEVLKEIKQFLTNKVLYGRLSNKRANLKKSLNKVMSIKCPLDKKHLFTQWSKIQTHSADTFADGSLKCGVYCNFLCNKHLKPVKTNVDTHITK